MVYKLYMKNKNTTGAIVIITPIFHKNKFWKMFIRFFLTTINYLKDKRDIVGQYYKQTST